MIFLSFIAILHLILLIPFGYLILSFSTYFKIPYNKKYCDKCHEYHLYYKLLNYFLMSYLHFAKLENY